MNDRKRSKIEKVDNDVDPFSKRHALNMMLLTLRRQQLAGPLRRSRLVARSLRSIVYPLKPPVFVIGAPRSGTTFLGNCIAHLPGICYFHEPEVTKCAVARVYNLVQKESVGVAVRQMKGYYSSMYKWLLATRNGRSGNVLAEKTPRNCFIVDFLAEAFPGSRFIEIIRDGRDSAASNAKKAWLDAAEDKRRSKDTAGYRMGSHPQFWTEAEDFDAFRVASTLRRSAWAWRRYTSEARAALERIDPGRVCSVRYEDMVNEPIAYARMIADFVQCSDEADLSAFIEAMTTADRRSIGRARRELSPDELWEVEQECGSLLVELGYSRGDISAEVEVLR